MELMIFTTAGHVEWHLEVGLAIQLVEAPVEAQKLKGNLPLIMNEHCAALGKPTAGNAAGRQSATDLSGLPLGPYPQKKKVALAWRPNAVVAKLGCAPLSWSLKDVDANIIFLLM